MRQRKRTFNHTNKRHFVACVFALVTSTAVIPGMTVYLPLTTPDKIGLPILLFPFLWAALFIYSYLAKRFWHPMLVMAVLLISHIALSVSALK